MNRATSVLVYVSWLYLFILFYTHSSPHYNLEMEITSEMQGLSISEVIVI